MVMKASLLCTASIVRTWGFRFAEVNALIHASPPPRQDLWRKLELEGLYGTVGKMGQVAGSCLRAARIVNADEQDRGVSFMSFRR